VSIDTDPRIGTGLLGYRIEALIGRGGMGVVYRAHDPRLKRKLALKLIGPDVAEDERFRARFLRESELAAALEHPNVVPIYDAGEADGQLYIAMRYIEGHDLRALLREEGRLEPARALAVCAQVADALDAAHERGLVHRDVKPSNVLLDASGHAYLADFGLSRRLAEHGAPFADGRSLGTPAYVAPEQIEGGPVDGRADVYSLGCLLYECLTGEPPFALDSRLAVVFAHLEAEPPKASERNVGLPSRLDAVIAKGMAKDRDDRYERASELASAASEALGLVGAARWSRTRYGLAPGVLLFVLIAALAVFAFSRGDAPARPSGIAFENTVVRIDPETNRVDAVIEVGADPYAVAAAGSTAWAYNLTDGTVSEIDAATNDVRSTTAISTSPLEIHYRAGPVIAADRSAAWVVGGVARLEGVVTKLRPDSTEKQEFRLSYDLWGVAIGEGAVWVAAREVERSVLLRISPRTGAVVARVQLPPDVDANAIAVGEGAVWVADTYKALLIRIDPQSSTVTGRVDLGSSAIQPVVGLGYVWILVSDEGDLLRIRPRSLRVAGAVHSQPNRDGSAAIGAGSVWWNDMNEGTVVRLDANGRIDSTIRLTPPQDSWDEGGLFSRGIAVGAGGVWVSVDCRTTCP
jgi:predicted Ser/Thr protein kinase